MDIAIVIGLLLLFLGFCVAVVAFEVKRHGWRPVIRYIIFAVVIRVLIHFSTQHIGETEQIVIPLAGAGVLVWLWPHILKQRMHEREHDAELPENNTVDEQP